MNSCPDNSHIKSLQNRVPQMLLLIFYFICYQLSLFHSQNLLKNDKIPAVLVVINNKKNVLILVLIHFGCTFTHTQVH